MKSKIVIFLFSIVLVGCTVGPNSIFGEVQNIQLPEKHSMSGQVSGEGVSFAINDSSYLNINLTGSENIKVFLESVPKIISLNVEAYDSSTTSANLTIGKLEPNKSYYKYEDSYKNKAVFVSDDNGNYTWTQDLAGPHHIWFQEAPSATVFKSFSFSNVALEDSTEDSTAIFLPEQCSNYGVWNPNTLICTLNQDINKDVEITDDNITLDCNNYKITGANVHNGVYLYKRKNINVKNCKILDASSGISIYSSTEISIEKNTISGAHTGVNICYSSNNSFKGNGISGNLNGINFCFSDSNNFINNTLSDSGSIGINLYLSNNNTLADNDVFNKDVVENSIGINLYSSNNNTLINNDVSGIGFCGIELFRSSFNTVIDNSMTDNGEGVDVYDSIDNKIYHNNFINNFYQVYLYEGSNNLFDNGYPSGGNYWSDYSGVDLNNDGIGDVAYTFYGGQDGYPFIKQDGWKKSSKNPVLIVPGLLGTEMKKGDELLWANVPRMINPLNSDSFMDPLSFNSDLTPMDNSVYKNNVIRKEPFFDYTDGLINEFKDQGYTEDENLFMFPYDWRYGVSGKYADGSTNADLLAQKIQDILTQTGSDKVDIIAHSLGGLIVKQYTMNHPTDNHIGKAVFVGVPNTGAPTAAKVLLQGDNFGVLGLNDQEMKKIAANMPATYDLLPGQQYYDTKGSYIETIDQTKCLEDFTTPCEVKDLNHQESDNFLIEKNLNSLAMDGADGLHTQAFDNFDLRTAGIDLYAIDGCKSATLSKVISKKYNDIFGEQFSYDARFAPGDNTVPLESATNLPIDSNKKYYALSGEHSKLLSQNGIRQEIVNLISGSNLSVGNNLITQDINQCQLNGKAISVFSPVDIFVTDQNGNRLGLAEDGSIINEIPNADFEIWGDPAFADSGSGVAMHKFLYLPQDNGQTYNINLKGTDTGTYTIKSQDINNNQIVETEVFSNLPVTANLTGGINIDAENKTSLFVKQNSDSQEQIILPSATIDAPASEDLLPPISTATINGTVGQQGFYRSNVLIKMKAVDDLSGVLSVSYNLDNTGYQKISGDTANISVSSEGKHTLLLFSTDKAGNNEPEKIINFTIDKTSPEALIQFDPTIKDLKFIGTDNISDSSLISVSDKDDTILLTDQAGNTTEIKLRDRNRRIKMSAEIKSLKYNGISADINTNRMVFSWRYDKNKNLKMLSQYVKSRKDYNISAIFDGKVTKISGKDYPGKISQSFPGLKIIKVTTSKGDLVWSY